MWTQHETEVLARQEAHCRIARGLVQACPIVLAQLRLVPGPSERVRGATVSGVGAIGGLTSSPRLPA